MPTATDRWRRYFEPEVLKTIGRLEVRARHVVEGFVSGRHRSPYHGFSVEFAEYREYVPGDDIKHIDWKVWGRSDRFFLKQYEEETNLRCHLLLDCSRSMAYGEEQQWSKFDYGATFAACLAILLQRQQDAVGCMLFDRDIRRRIPPSTHQVQVQTILQELADAPQDHDSHVEALFPTIPAQLGRRGLVVIVSDLFLDLDALDKLLRGLRQRRHEVLICHLLHQDEEQFPFDGNTLFLGLETDQQLMADAPALRQAYLQALRQFRHRARTIAATLQCDYLPATTATPLDALLTRYLAARQQRTGTRSR